MKNLGKTEQSVYEFLKEYIEENKNSPSVREICEALGLKSTSTVHFHLKSLQERGLIRIIPHQQRSIKLINTQEVKTETVNVPLVGTVAAGTPIYAFDDIQETFPLPRSVLRSGNTKDVFMLTVDGESMIEAGILNGDILLVHKGISSENGDIVVARVYDESATVKRIYKEKNKIRLQPENSRMEPIIVDFKDVIIVGKVIGLFRKYL